MIRRSFLQIVAASVLLHPVLNWQFDPEIVEDDKTFQFWVGVDPAKKGSDLSIAYLHCYTTSKYLD